MLEKGKHDNLSLIKPNNGVLDVDTATAARPSLINALSALIGL